jgi:methylated-DNA-protein-cysteine methyltransferase-like protein
MREDTTTEASLDQRIWMTVCAVPRGRISTYGDIAERAGLPGAARRVGAALRKLPKGSEVPWHRIVNARGRSSLPPGSMGADRQRALLAEEGVLLGAGGATVLRRYRW